MREVVPVTTGFTRVEIVGPELLLNGEPLLIAGVNRHDHHHLGGKAASDAELRADVDQHESGQALRVAAREAGRDG